MDRNASWTKERILKRLRLEVESREFAEQYELLRSREPALAPFGPPEGLIGALRDPRGASLDQKDELLHALVRSAQRDQDLGTCAQTLLAVGMWPALEHTSWEFFYLEDHLDPFAEVYGAFLDEVSSFNLAKQSKIAVNLRLNTKKRVSRGIAREIRYQAFIEAHTFVSTDPDLLMEEPERYRTFKLKELVKDISSMTPGHCPLRHCLRRAAETRQAPSSIEATLMEQVADNWLAAGHLSPEDHRLIVAHAVRGLSLAQIGRELGLSEVAARVRYHRLKRKLAERLAREPRCA